MTINANRVDLYHHTNAKSLRCISLSLNLVKDAALTL